MRHAAEKTADEVERDFKKTTRTWDRQVVFFKRVRAYASKGRVGFIVVGTKDRIYQYVNDGTIPHHIAPVRAKALSFLARYKAKTTPMVISSRRGGSSGRRRFAKFVRHPGSKARRFDIAITQRHNRRQTLPNHLKRELRVYFKRVAAQSK